MESFSGSPFLRFEWFELLEFSLNLWIEFKNWVGRETVQPLIGSPPFCARPPHTHTIISSKDLQTITPLLLI